MKKRLVGALLALSLLGIGITAGVAKNYGFKVVNDSDFIIVGFYTNEGDGWSSNWLRHKVHAGDSADMEFAQDGPCQIRVRVGWETKSGGEQVGEPWRINICDAREVIFDGDQVTYK